MLKKKMTFSHTIVAQNFFSLKTSYGCGDDSKLHRGKSNASLKPGRASNRETERDETLFSTEIDKPNQKIVL